MRLINAEKLRAEAIESCKFCHLNGSKYCREKCEINALTKLIDKAPTVEPIGQIIKAYTTGFDTGVETVKRPQGERAERALSIIDRLYTEGHINNMEQGVLRRIILFPEKGGAE